MNKTAKLLSVILGPQVWLPVLVIIEVTRTHLSLNQVEILLPLLIFFQLLIPGAFLTLLLKRKKVTAWDLPKREERDLFLMFTFACYFISLILFKLLGNQLLLNLEILLIVLMIVLFIISRFWKISLHASLNTSGSILVNFLFGWKLSWLYLSIPIICWARFSLKRHDLWQVITGTLVSGLILLEGLAWFGYL